MDQLENCGEGVKIGASEVSSPTCADDIALLAENQTDAQILTNTVHTASCKDRFIINPSKSEIVKFKTAKKQAKVVQVQLGGQNISQVSQAIHLGVERNENNTPDTQKRIETARKTMYALLGSGMHGKNGISPVITIQMWNTFVLPRLLHGIELLDIRKKRSDRFRTISEKSVKTTPKSTRENCQCGSLSLGGGKNH